MKEVLAKPGGLSWVTSPVLKLWFTSVPTGQLKRDVHTPSMVGQTDVSRNEIIHITHSDYTHTIIPPPTESEGSAAHHHTFNHHLLQVELRAVAYLAFTKRHCG